MRAPRAHVRALAHTVDRQVGHGGLCRAITMLASAQTGPGQHAVMGFHSFFGPPLS